MKRWVKKRDTGRQTERSLVFVFITRKSKDKQHIYLNVMCVMQVTQVQVAIDLMKCVLIFSG